MEAKNMAAPENLRRGILPITAPQRERTVTPVLPRPEIGTAPEAPFQPKKGKERKGPSKKARIALAGLAVAGAGVGAYESYQNIPAVHRAVDSAFLDHIRGKSLTSEASVFDNSAVKGKISPANILYVPKEDFDKTPLADENGAPIFDFPWDKNNPAEIKYTKTLWPEPDWWKSDVDPKTEIKNQFEATTTLPAGFELPTPYPGRVFFSNNPYNAEEIDMASIIFLAPDGILYFVNISIDRNSGGNLPFEPLIDVVLKGSDNQNGRDWKKGTLVERGQKIFRVTQKGRLSMYMQGGKNGRIEGPETNMVPGNFQFQTQKDSAGVEKLLVPEGK